jgi:ubiquinone/menaquinone biosynthesis C-methylase UbiE
MRNSATPELKTQVRDFWNEDPCGTRYLGNNQDFEAHARARYALEPHIQEFAKFSSASGLRVLEIGVGLGADYLQWLMAGAKACGVDLSSVSIEMARRRCELAGYRSELRIADAEKLPFSDNAFDIVYSYGVLHHSPDTAQCFREVWRVLRPGGEARIMIYHHPSLTGAMLCLRYGVWKAKSIRRSVYDYLESPGTKTYTRGEARSLMSGFEDVVISQVLGPGDLLLNQPSARFRSPIYRLVWKLYPRKLARMFGRRLGLFLLISGRKLQEPEMRLC